MRLILITGKGGVGKTTVAAATALRAAGFGHRTLVMSTDPAHSLGDSLEERLSGDPRQVRENVLAQEVDVLREMDSHWGTVQEWVKALLAWRGLEETIAGEIAILPGMEELAGLLYILEHYENPDLDLLIVDCAPTGETLRLLSFPDVLRWWLDHVFPIERQAARVLGPIASTLWKLPVPREEVFDAAKALTERLIRMRQLLTDPQTASVRLVLNPERMVVREAQRTFTYLGLYGYHTDLVVENRVLPDSVRDPYFDSWRADQSRQGELIVSAFSPIPIRRVPLMEREAVGVEMLERLGTALYGDDDPAQVFYRGRSREFLEEKGRRVLEIPLPFAEKSDVVVTQHGDELAVRVGNQKRNIILPRTFAVLEASEAKLENNRL